MKKIYSGVFFILCSAIGIHTNAQTTTFNYTGSVQTYTVPPCVSSINVTVLGAKGGDGASISGGSGGFVQATIPVTAGEVLEIYVGEAGINNVVTGPTTFNGGGSVFSYSSAGTAGTGGGASDIRRSPYSVNDKLVVAGGGGGGGYQNCAGGHGGGLIGQDGVPFPSWPNAGGKGGTQLTGGDAGIACCSCPTYTTSGSFGQGGNGSGDGAGGGAGGGGYYGGGGACFSGGGGGSSYTDPSVTGVTHVQGFQNGSGQVVITVGATGVPVAPGAIAGSTTFCENVLASFSINPVGGATSYTWSVPSGSTITSGQGTTAVTVTFGSTSGNVSVTADNICGSSTASNLAITVVAAPTVTANTTASAICAGNSVTLSGGGAINYSWTGSVTDNVAFTPVSTDTYTVTGIDANGCSASASVTVTVNPLPTVAVSFPMDTVCLGGGMVTLAGESPSGGTWSGTGVSANMFDPMVPGVGWTAINYSYTDGNSCTNSITDSLNVDVCAGIAALTLTGSVSIYPNPNEGTFTILLNSTISELVITITDMQGRVVYSSIENNAFTGYVKQISLENESSGLYLLHINANGEQLVEKISVQK